MSEPFIKDVGKGASLLARVAVGALLTAAIAGLGVVVLQFMSYQGQGGIPGDQTFSQVSIISPPHGTLLEVGDSIMVETTAIGSQPFQRLELWLNGMLLGIQNAPDGGIHPFSPYFVWRPVEPGIYSLVAAAIDVNGNQTFSTQVVVMVALSESVNAFVSLEAPTLLPALVEGEGGPSPEPGDDTSSGPAGSWSLSIGDWVTSLTADQAPAAPQLAARAVDCTANLHIHDLSGDEEGFIVYRQTLSSSTWTQVAALNSQAEFEWIIYTDEGSLGPLNYYVTAFNSQGESMSNLAYVYIDPAECPAADRGSSRSSFGLTLQIPDLRADQVYCYLSTDGANWSRWPQSGFLTPAEGGVQSPLLVLNLPGSEAGEQQAGPVLSLFLDCWGWDGGELLQLGTMSSHGITPQAGSRLPLQGEGISAELVIEQAILPGQTSLLPVSNELLNFSEYLLNLGVVDGVSPSIPRVNLWVTEDREMCGQHLPPDAQNMIGQLLYCFPYPAYDLTKGASITQPYLVWGFDFEPICEGGVGEHCKSYWELLNMAEQTGGQVGFTIVSLLGATQTVWNVTEPDLTMFVVPPTACLGSIDYSVRLWYRPGNEGTEVMISPEQNISEVGEFEISPQEILFGPYSNWVSIPCNSANMLTPSIVEHYREIEIIFEDVSFMNLNDGGGDDYLIESDDSVELYGYFRVQAPSFGHWHTGYCFASWAGNCDQQPYWAGTRRYLLVADWEEDQTQNLKLITSGPLNIEYEELQYWDLCLASSKYSCKFEGQSTSAQEDNNSITVIIKEGDTLTIEVRLVDYDELSGDDDVCVGSIMIPTEDFIYGSLSETYSFYIVGQETDSGDCVVDGSIVPWNWISPDS